MLSLGVVLLLYNSPFVITVLVSEGVDVTEQSYIMARTRRIPDGRVECDFPSINCHAYFKRRYDMLRHKREYHNGRSQCPQLGCHYATKRLYRMTKHIKKEHTGKQYIISMDDEFDIG